MFDKYEFRQTLNGFIVIKNSGDSFRGGEYSNQVWVFNSSEEMGQWVTKNLIPADAPTAEAGGE